MGRHSTAIAVDTISPPASPSKKRKRDHSSAAEIEVNVSAPEPPSKKALRKAKKSQHAPATTDFNIKQDTKSPATNPISEETLKPQSEAPKRSDYAIWIGNLPWTATKLDLRAFLTRDSQIKEGMIIRLHMPPPSKSTIAASKQKIKPQNQGFAYVDFSSKEALVEALTLSEKLITGRRVLIKDAKSFEGRPEKSKVEPTPTNPGKPPSNRIFVGNLGFDTTKEMLKTHFVQCGEIADVHLATFEDTGKCKGYAWVEFTELDAGEKAVRGWVNLEQENSGYEDPEISEALADQTKPKKNPRLRRWWINRLEGRPLRMEFAEGKDVRYKKRFGKEGTSKKEGDTAVDSAEQPIAEPPITDADVARPLKTYQKSTKTANNVDARTIKPGAALAAAPRLTGGIVESQGKKTTFV